MITKKKHSGWHCYYKEDKYISIFDHLCSGNLEVLEIFKNTPPHTKVMLVKTCSGPLVVKLYSPKKKTVEKFFKSILLGSYNENLIYQIDSARNDGITIPNDYYFLAERRVFRFARVVVMFFEYIPGPLVSDFGWTPAKLKNEICATMKELHQVGIISSDPHGRNFIVSEGRVRAIDLSGKKYSAKRVAEDNILLERYYSIPVDKGVMHQFINFRHKLRGPIRIIKSLFLLIFRKKSVYAKKHPAIYSVKR